jgi:hypothetical protein
MISGRRGAKSLDELTLGVIDEALAARGLGETSLIAAWPAIVGNVIARYARPLQLRWSPRSAKRDPHGPVAPATLILRLEGAFALEAQHNAAIIVERVNAHLGWRCVDRVAFRQGPLPPLRERRQPPPAPGDAAEREARQLAAAIGDEALREALTRFGAHAIERSARKLVAGNIARGGVAG